MPGIERGHVKFGDNGDFVLATPCGRELVVTEDEALPIEDAPLRTGWKVVQANVNWNPTRLHTTTFRYEPA